MLLHDKVDLLLHTREAGIGTSGNVR
jgi:hypothetical protein